MTNEEYLIELGEVCPYCYEFGVIATGIVELDGKQGWQDVMCPACNETWTDEFSIIGFIPNKNSHRGHIHEYCTKCEGVCQYDSEGNLKKQKELK